MISRSTVHAAALMRRQGLGWEVIARRLGVTVHDLRSRMDPDYCQIPPGRSGRVRREVLESAT